jgi:hypothetical protein
MKSKNKKEAYKDLEARRKGNRFFDMVDKVPYNNSKKGEIKIFETSSRQSQSKKQLPLENIKHISWVDGKVTVIYKDGNKLTSNANEIELLANYKNENDIPLNDHCL